MLRRFILEVVQSVRWAGPVKHLGHFLFQQAKKRKSDDDRSSLVDAADLAQDAIRLVSCVKGNFVSEGD